MNSSAAEKIIVALDVPTDTEALSLMTQLSGEVGAFKIGFQRYVGVDVIRHAGYPADLTLHEVNLDTGRVPLAELLEHVDDLCQRCIERRPGLRARPDEAVEVEPGCREAAVVLLGAGHDLAAHDVGDGNRCTSHASIAPRMYASIVPAQPM